jgi:hypothetical protein
MNKLTRLSWLAALCVSSAGAYAFAQGKPVAPAPKPAAMSCEHACPMHGAMELADIQVEQTREGAIIKLVAKKPEDVQKVQQLAAKLGGEGGGCPMHDAMHEGHHGGMMHHHPPTAPAPAPAPAPKK